MDFKFCLLVAVVAIVFGNADSKPVAELQHLPPKPGYVPVYIRLGDTPLDEINAELAEAFREQRGVRPEEAGRALAAAEGADEDTKEEDKSEDGAPKKDTDLDDLGDVGFADDDKEEKPSAGSDKSPSDKPDDDQLPLQLDNVSTSGDDSDEEQSSSSKPQESSVHIQKIPKTNKKQQS